MSKPKKIFVTGGHITPAIAVIDQLQTMNPQWEIILVGRNALEEMLANEKGIRYLASRGGRITSVKVLVGFVQALYLCLRERPDIVISFGGYVALPVAVSAWLLRIPVITHEQTRIPGLANRIIGRIARRVCVTFEDTAGAFPGNKTVVTGLPIRKELFTPPDTSPLGIRENRPLLYITGGSTGAESLNALLFLIIPQLISRYIVIHQTGLPGFGKAKEIKSAYYIARDFFDVNTLSWIYRNADLVIARSGANTVMELAMLGKKAILVPLPWSAGGEQMANAQWYAKTGLGEIIEQSEVVLKQFLNTIQKQMVTTRAPKILLDVPRNGASRVAEEIDAILQ